MDKLEYEELKNAMIAFVNGPAQSYAKQIEETQEVSVEIWKELQSRGYLRLTAPKEYGGFGLSFVEYMQLLEIISQIHGSMRVIFHVYNGLWRAIDYLADEDQRERYTKAFVQGQKRITFTLTEPHSGSGTDIQTTVRREGTDYVVNGEKWMIIFSDVADEFLVFCRLEGTQGADGILALMVPRDAEGLEIKPMASAMGISGTHHGHLIFRHCRIPAANRLGAEGQGLEVAFTGFLDPSRAAIGMTCVGLAARALELAIAHAKQRITFGKPLSQRQTIQMWVAEMATDIEAARQVCMHAARAYDAGQPVTTLAAMAKLYSTEMLQRVTDQSLQIHGGIGYFQSSEIERIYRDARMQRFEEGTAETQKMVISRQIFMS